MNPHAGKQAVFFSCTCGPACITPSPLAKRLVSYPHFFTILLIINNLIILFHVKQKLAACTTQLRFTALLWLIQLFIYLRQHIGKLEIYPHLH